MTTGVTYAMAGFSGNRLQAGLSGERGSAKVDCDAAAGAGATGRCPVFLQRDLEVVPIAFWSHASSTSLSFVLGFCPCRGRPDCRTSCQRINYGLPL